MTSIDTKDQNENSSENIAATKPITSIMEDYEKGTLKLTEVQVLVNEAKINRQVQGDLIRLADEAKKRRAQREKIKLERDSKFNGAGY